MVTLLQATNAPLYPSSEIDISSTQVHSILERKKADLSRLNLEIWNAQALLHNLIHERDQALKYVDAHRALLAPISQMPLDVMIEIFTHCLPKGPYIRPDPRSAPLLLAQVCSAWRHVVLSTPKLWKSLAIQLYSRNSGRGMALTNSWLSRTGGYPISLFAAMTGDEAAGELLRIINTRLAQLKDLRISLPYRTCDKALQILNNGTPCLEKLQMRFFKTTHPEVASSPEKLILTGDSAPNLRSFLWSSQGLQHITFSFHATHLTELDVDHPLSIPDCVRIMEQCPKLISCEFRAISTWDPTFMDVHPILLPELHLLALHTSQPIGSLFERLMAPTLQVLKVVDLGHDFDVSLWSQSSMNDFLTRSECSLRNLYLLNVLSSEDDLIQCLRWTSNSLVELRLLDSKGVTVVMDRVLQLLTVRETPDGYITCLCPKLEVMKLGTSLQSSDGVLAQMVESRWRSPSSRFDPAQHQVVRLKSINPRLNNANHPEDIRRLAILREEGLELV
ncbi:hypothetical protein BD779DRAFT_1668983 [Infundibulicybe gibba]|nr:hypothetical protein BD779DRAFT_1668983 [Infundibulicybe gibba]